MADLQSQLRDIIIRNFPTSDDPRHEWYFPSEWNFSAEAKYRFDFAWPKKLIAFECQGGTWMKKSKHSSGPGLQRDYLKYNYAQSIGWIVLQFDTHMVMGEGYVVQTIKNCLELR